MSIWREEIETQIEGLKEAVVSLESRLKKALLDNENQTSDSLQLIQKEITSIREQINVFELLNESILDELRQDTERVQSLRSNLDSLKVSLEQKIVEANTAIDNAKNLVPQKGDKGDRGDRGESPSVSLVVSEVLSLIPKPKDGKNAEPSEIIDLVIEELLKKGLKISDIKGLEERLRNIASQVVLGGRGGGGDTLETISLSSQLNGVLKTFTLGATKAASEVVALQASQGPNIYEPITHFTFTAPRTITLTAAVTAPSAGQVLLAICKMA